MGGSWLAPANLIAAKDWGAIEKTGRRRRVAQTWKSRHSVIVARNKSSATVQNNITWNELSMQPNTGNPAPSSFSAPPATWPSACLWPSLYALDCDGLLPEPFQLVGAATSSLTAIAFISKVKESIQSSANASMFDENSSPRLPNA